MRHRILSILTVFLLTSMVFSVKTFNVSANDFNDDLENTMMSRYKSTYRRMVIRSD